MASFAAEQNGDWSNPATWGETVEYPMKSQDGDTVVIGSSYTVTYDLGSSGKTTYRCGKVNLDGELTFATDQNTYLWIRGDTSNAIDSTGGDFTIGSEGSPLSSSYTCTIEIDQATDGTGRCIDFTNDGNAQIFGMVKTISGITTSALTADSSNTFTMSSVPSDWAIGDELVIQDTTNDRLLDEDDEVTITNISGTTITFTGNGSGSTAEFSHLTSAIILNLTRNIKFIATSTSNRSDYGLYAANCTANVQYVDFNGNTYCGHGGAFKVGTQGSGARTINIEGCTVRNQGSDGCSVSAGQSKFNKLILYNNIYKGMDGSNEYGSAEIKNSYFVGNQAGFIFSGRGTTFVSDCIFWSNTNGAIPSGTTYFTNCRFFDNSGAHVVLNGDNSNFNNCIFGESYAGTQVGFSAIKCQYSPPKCNDCKFSDGIIFQTQNADGEMAYSSNHNQVGGAFFVDYAQSGQSVETDLVTYRTSSPSIKMIPVVYGNFVQYKIPVKCESGTALSVTIYGKKSTTSLWENPKARLIGCGLDDSDEWGVSDTNWNSITLTGTPSRDGMATIFIMAYSAQFNVDDITLS